MDYIGGIISSISGYMYGYILIALLIAAGLYFSLRTKFVQLRLFRESIQVIAEPKKDRDSISSFQALMVSTASRVGTGNIVGVTGAIIAGGPGAVFWMWLIALIGCGTKYCEIALAIKYREKNEAGEWVGGAAYYLRALGGGIGKFLGGWYAIGLMIELIPSLCTQALSATEQFLIFGVDQKISGAILGILVALIIAGGVNRVLKVTDIMVPVMAVLYLVGAFVIIFMNASQILPALGSIFVYAFTPHAAIGGFAGSTIALALRWGAARGVYSNEAGFGTAPTAHSTASVDHPIRQACWGVFEVTVDTLIVCTVTALVTLTTGMWTTTEYGTGAIAQAAFHNAFGTFGDYFVAISVFLFVFSTLISCCMFGWKQAEYLFGLKFSKIWKFHTFSRIETDISFVRYKYSLRFF